MLGSIEVVEPAEEQGPKVIGTGAGNGLNAANALLRNDRGVITQNKAGSSGGEFRKTSYRKVLVVVIGVVK